MYTDWDGDAWREREKIDKKERVATNRDLEKFTGSLCFWAKGVKVKNMNWKSKIIDRPLDWKWNFEKDIDKQRTYTIKSKDTDSCALTFQVTSSDFLLYYQKILTSILVTYTNK